jgi:methylenetetrahydrofolate dehydrogenase (NADP+) / methenyltetrahydrofolate cyclohydrolase
MTALVLDGAAMAREVLDELRPRVEALVRRGVTPGLATVIVGDNPASRVYVRNKIKACAEVGVK